VDYSRYDIPSACVQAALSAGAVAERTAIDTTPYAPERDTLPTASIEAARQCGSRFVVDQVAPRELLSVVQLGLMTTDEKKANAAVDRMLSLTSDPAQRAWTLFSIFQAYFGARPMQLAKAKRVTARLDSLGAAAAVPAMNAHGMLLLDAQRRFDVTGMEREASAILHLDPFVNAPDRDDILYGSGNAAFALLSAELYRSPQTAVAQTMRLVRATGYRWPSDSATTAAYLTAIISPIGRPAPALDAKYWYGPHGKNTWVVPGKASLLVIVPDANEMPNYGQYTMLRKLHEKYGDALNITIMSRTVGYIHDSPPLEPAQEADSIRSYFQDFLKLPVTVGVIETPFHRLPDGRRVNGPVPFEGQNVYMYGDVLADRSGNVLVIGESSQAGLEAYIDRTIH
jgi:hypothetical protein